MPSTLSLRSIYNAYCFVQAPRTNVPTSKALLPINKSLDKQTKNYENK